jgi:hypothetical protein
MMIFICSVFLSCQNENANLNNPGNDVIENTQYRDFQGYEFVIEVRDNDGWETIPDSENISVEADATRAHIAKVKELLNCEITQNKHAPDATTLASFATGDSGFDIVNDISVYLYPWYRAGYLACLNGTEALDLTDAAKWGTPEMLKGVSYRDEIFGVITRLWGMEYFVGEGALYVNDGLVEYFNQTHPKELIEKGSWTFNGFNDYIKNVYDTNEEIYSFTYDPVALNFVSVFANGCEFIEKDSNNKSVFGLNNQKAYTALEWASALVKEEGVKEGPHSWSSGSYFSKNKSTFYLGGVAEGIDVTNNNSFLNCDIIYSWIPFPYGPDAEYGKTVSSYTSTKHAISIAYDTDIEAAAYFINVLFSDRDELKHEDKLQMYKTQFMHHAEDFATYSEYNTKAHEMYFNSGLSDVRAKLTNALTQIIKGKKTPAEGMGSVTDSMQTEIDELFNN